MVAPGSGCKDLYPSRMNAVTLAENSPALQTQVKF